MALTFSVGGAQRMFDGPTAAEVHGLLDQTFGADDEWNEAAFHAFGTLPEGAWADLQNRALEHLPRQDLENLLAMTSQGRGVYLPAHVRSLDLPLSGGRPLCCASLLGLHTELTELAQHLGMTLKDDELDRIIQHAHADVASQNPPALLAFAHLARAANEAMRKGCPLWVLE